MFHFSFVTFLIFSIAATSFILVMASPVANKKETKKYTFAEIQPVQDLVWYPCEEEYFCAMLQVPLYYSKPNEAHAAVPLIKLAARINSTTESYKKMILTNPGRPGLSRVDSVITYGSLLQSVIRSNYDIVAFDPRGIANSSPLANCSITPSSVRRSLIHSGSNFAKSFYNNTITAATIAGAACKAVIGGENEAGPHMTTTTNARDMVSIIDAFALTAEGKGVDGAELVNYWGFSYGSFIGEMFASIFPDRVGRFVLDGIVDADNYVSGFGLQSIIFTDDAFLTFFESCHLTGPLNCPFYTGNSTNDIYSRFDRILNSLSSHQAEALHQTDAPLVETYLETFKNLIFESTYYPITFYPILSDLFLAFEAAVTNITVDALQNIEINLQAKLVTVKNVPVALPALAEWFPAVACSDSDGSAYGETLGEFSPYIQALKSQSTIAGDLWASQRVQCSAWPIRSTDRFAGPFGGKTKTPMLFVSNTVDTATPIVNGQKYTAKFEGATLLTIEGVGHTSLGSLNKCAFAKIRDYFQAGVLPAPKTVCSVEQGPFDILLNSVV